MPRSERSTRPAPSAIATCSEVTLFTADMRQAYDPRPRGCYAPEQSFSVMPKTLSPIVEESVADDDAVLGAPGGSGDARPGVRRRRRVRRSGQLRDEHQRRREVRLPAPVGASLAANLHGHAHPEPVGEDGHRDGPQPARAVPHPLPASGDVGALGPGRARRHGDRPGGVRRRGDRAEPAVRRAAVRGGAHDRGRRLRGARAPAPRAPPLRDRDRRDARRRPARASSTTRCGSASTAARRRKGLDPGLRGHRQRPARHRHPRRDGHAARHLPALGADAGADRTARRRREAPPAALPARRRHDRDGARRAGRTWRC